MIRSADLFAPMKSRPVYQPLAPDKSGTRHLVVCERDAPADLAVRFAGLAPDVLTQEAGFRTLSAVLETACMGLRLYLVGSEAFVWQARQVAEAYGLGEGEILLAGDSSGPRRAQCVHCKTFANAVTTPTYICAGCGLRLLVRDHFSRRLAAFQAVAVRAESRGRGMEETLPA